MTLRRYSLATLTVCLWLMAGMNAPTTAQDNGQVTRNDIIRVLRQLHTLPVTRENLERTGYKGEKIDIMIEHERAMMADTRFVSRVADRLLALQNGEVDPALMGGIIRPLYIWGLARLSLSEMRYYLNVEMTLIRALPVSKCGRYMKGLTNGQSDQRAQEQMVTRLNAPALREYKRIQRKAALQGAIHNGPPTLSNAAIKASQDRFFAVLKPQLASAGLDAKLTKARGDLRKLSHKDACNAGLIRMQTMHDYTGKNPRMAMQIFLLNP